MTSPHVYVPIVSGPAIIARGQCLFAELSPSDPKISRRRRKRGKRRAELLPPSPWESVSLGNIDDFRITIRPRAIPGVRLLHPDLRKP